jgi:hypothetical protein
MYYPSNSTLVMVFTAAPPTPMVWVSWGINPTGERHDLGVGHSCFKKNNIIVAKTFDLKYHSIVRPARLSFDIWNLNAKEVEGWFFFLQFHAMIKTLEGAKEVKHLSLAGPKVNKDGIILEHALNPDNKHTIGKLKLKGAKASSRLTTVSFYLLLVFVIFFKNRCFFVCFRIWKGN